MSGSELVSVEKQSQMGSAQGMEKRPAEQIEVQEAGWGLLIEPVVEMPNPQFSVERPHYPLEFEVGALMVAGLMERQAQMRLSS
jgi:hypothetical protein